MPVNDSPDYTSMMSNCALCTVAGLTGSTAETIRAQIKSPGDHSDDADMAFLFYAKRNGIPKSTTLATQMKGVKRYLRVVCGLTVTQIVKDKLSERSALSQMMSYPEGSMFAVLVCDLSLSQTMSNAHWLAASKTNGQIRFVDFQLDTQDSQQLTQLKRRQKQLGNPLFGAPHVTDDPRRAWGKATKGTDQFIVLGITQGQRQNTAVAAIGTFPPTSAELSQESGITGSAE